MLKEKTKAPNFTLPDQNGNKVQLNDFKGKVILYFYPKDMTPGCTVEAQNFRDDYAQLKKKGVTIIGISADSVARHKKFCEKEQLPFILLSDEDKTTIKAYKAWGKKKFMGREFMGILRVTYVIERGKILKAYDKVTPKTHSKEILADLQ